MSTATLAERRAQAARDKRAMVPLLRAVAGMVLFSLALVTFARIMGFEPAATPDDTAPVAQERMIRIVSSLDGSALIYDEAGGLIADLGPMQAGFIGGVDRSLARVRIQNNVAGNPPVRLVQFADGRLAVRDPSTGWRAELVGFGETNRESFLALLPDQDAGQSK